MATDTPESESRRLVATCPSCGARCRLRQEVPHGSPRCPRCSAVLGVAPRRSKAAPARRRPPAGGDEEQGAYAISAAEEPARRPPLPSLEDKREEEPQPPEPPAHPLLQGVYGYPWKMEHLRAWFLFGLGFSIVALLGAAVFHLIILYVTSDEVGKGVFFRVLILFIKGLVAFTFLTGMFAASYFLAVIQETAAGNEEFQGPDDISLGEKLIDFLYLVWIGFWAAVFPVLAGVALARLTQEPLLGIVALPLFAVFFPQLLLGSLVNDSAVLMLSGDVIGGLLKRPGLLVGFTLASTLVLAPALILGVVTVLGLQYFLAPVTGYVFAASALIYARLLGRVGWILTHDGAPAVRGRRRKKRKRAPAE